MIQYRLPDLIVPNAKVLQDHLVNITTLLQQVVGRLDVVIWKLDNLNSNKVPFPQDESKPKLNISRSKNKGM